jgi:hypothetical protein
MVDLALLHVGSATYLLQVEGDGIAAYRPGNPSHHVASATTWPALLALLSAQQVIDSAPDAGSEAAAPGGDRLGEHVDPYACADCLANGDACVFHAGFAEGWDSCMEHVTAWALGRD